MKISVIIPAYNEDDRIGRTIYKVGEYMSRRHLSSPQDDYEILVVNDGSNDRTALVVGELMKNVPHLSLIDHKVNKGKGHAVKSGVLEASGDIILFMDADGSTPIESLDTLLSYLENGSAIQDGVAIGAGKAIDRGPTDIVVSSRRIKGAKIESEQSASRLFLGWFFRKITQLLTHIDVIDSQNGFKLFRAKAAKEIFQKTTVNGWAFDVEVLCIAKTLGYKCVEVPITWKNDERSRVTISGMIKMLRDLMLIGGRVRRGFYRI